MFPLDHERVLNTFYYTPEVSPDTRPHLRGTLSFLPQVKRSPDFPSSSRDEGRLHCFTLERNADVPVAPREEAGIYLTLEGNLWVLSQFVSHVFPHPLEIRPDSLAPIRMSAEN